MSNVKWTELIQIIESHLRSHNLRLAIDVINTLKVDKIPKELRHRFANLARRAGKNSWSMSLVFRLGAMIRWGAWLRYLNPWVMVIQLRMTEFFYRMLASLR